MKKTLSFFAAASLLIAASAVHASPAAEPEPVVAETAFEAPAAQEVAKEDLVQAHAVAEEADQDKAAGMGFDDWGPLLLAFGAVILVLSAL